MNVIIIGAGNIGSHLASLLSQMEYSVVLVDTDFHKLEKAKREFDIATRLGSGIDWELIEELQEFSPDLFLALTNNDETNLVSSNIAKNLGVPQTIARIRNFKYFMKSRVNFERVFSTDYLIGPEILTAEMICNMILIPNSFATESFSHGAIQMRSVKIPSTWDKEHIPLKKKEALELPEEVMASLIYRNNKFIFPRGEDYLLKDDEVTFIGESRSMMKLNRFLNLQEKLPRTVTIFGATRVGKHLATLLHSYDIKVLIIESDFQKCELLAQTHPFATIIHRNGVDFQYIQAEKLWTSDVFAACSDNDESNFVAATAFKQLGCDKCIVSLNDTSLLPLLKRYGIDMATSPRNVAANKILSIARQKTISSTISLYENQVQVMEVKISPQAKISGIPLGYLQKEFPKDFSISMIQSRGRIFPAMATRIVTPGDTIVVVTPPKYLAEMKKLF